MVEQEQRGRDAGPVEKAYVKTRRFGYRLSVVSMQRAIDRLKHKRLAQRGSALAMDVPGEHPNGRELVQRGRG